MKESIGYGDYTEIFLDEREYQSERERIEQIEREAYSVREQGALAHIPHKTQGRK